MVYWRDVGKIVKDLTMSGANVHSAIFARAVKKTIHLSYCLMYMRKIVKDLTKRGATVTTTEQCTAQTDSNKQEAGADATAGCNDSQEQRSMTQEAKRKTVSRETERGNKETEQQQESSNRQSKDCSRINKVWRDKRGTKHC